MNKSVVDFDVKIIDDQGGSPFGEFAAILSAPTKDRDGEVVETGAFEPLPPSIVIHADHRLSVDSAVARAVPTYEDGLLVLRGYFASDPDAQRLRAKVTEGIVTTMSAGFMSAERVDKGGVPHIVRAELLEGSFVTVPSNREATVLAIKELTGALAAKEVRRLERSSEARQEAYAQADYMTIAEKRACEDLQDPHDKSQHQEIETKPGTAVAPASAKSPADEVLIIWSRALADAASVA